ncbi:Major facilitator superfamily domain-containing protein 12 [Acropora cervicornis]|uniref:Major facilitator superfamily domain-containing protein 12 n=1 Tax=Acropora cervicornis TaxID=6130 RepID=A0AAD9Q059_ACRCE|nr:Major facilitator superfamily domain-containing protein 12 [Acropora cervicornis]
MACNPDELPTNYAAASQKEIPLSWRTKICYGVGHVLNDLSASMWFTYILVYLHKVVKFSNINAGALLLVGQVADAMCTPLVGIFSDRTDGIKYGRRKTWHLLGAIFVSISFPFVFNPCLGCESSGHWVKFFYYAVFIVLFQFGWAASQISHLSLIPELTEDDNEKCGLTAIRYAATGLCNIFVFVLTWILLGSSGNSTNSDELGSSDAAAFTYVVLIVAGTGILFTIIFHVGVKEHPRDCCAQFATRSSKRSAANWAAWFREPLFYQIGLMYMSVRLIINVTQVYIPMYTLETLGLSKQTIAIMPLVVYVSGFISTFFSKPLNRSLGRKAVLMSSLFIIIGTSVWLWFIPRHSTQMYGASAALGFGSSISLVTVLTMLADLIAENVMSNGIIIQLIQVFYPENTEPSSNIGGPYYRKVMVFVSGIAAVMALLTLLTVGKKNVKDDVKEDGGDARQTCRQSSSWALICSTGSFSPCESPVHRAAVGTTSEVMPLYGSVSLAKTRSSS